MICAIQLFSVRNIGPACALLALGVFSAACTARIVEAQAPQASAADALGVSRSVTLTPDSPPVETLLAEGEVILTFDDGPAGNRTRAVLDELDKECTKAVFFVLGREADREPAMVKEIAARGHTLASHSWSHTNLAGLPLAEAMKDIRRGRDSVAAAAGETPAAISLFRYPFVALTPELQAEAVREGIITITVTADGADWTDLSPEASVAQIMTRLEASGRKGIILLHDPFDRSDERVRLLLTQLKAGRFRIVSVNAAAAP